MAQTRSHKVPLDRGPDLIDTGRFSLPNRKRLSAPGLRTFLGIAAGWGLSEEARRLVLGYPARSTYHHWVRLAREGGELTLDVDVLLRISMVLGIHQALGVLFETLTLQRDWLTRPHGAPAFGGQPPLTLITSGSQDGLMLVRRFLDAARGGLYMPPGPADAGFAALEDADVVFS